MYGVGDIYITLSTVNPKDRFGGEWRLLAPGRTLVCIDTSDTDFNPVKKTGDWKHSEVVAQIGAFDSNSSAIGYTGSGKGGSAFIYGGPAFNPTSNNIANSRINHGTALWDKANNSASPSKLQPYIAVYMWERVS